MSEEHFDVRPDGGCVFELFAHMVFATRYRGLVFTGGHLARLEQIMGALCEGLGCELVEFNGKPDHVHVVVKYSPLMALSRLVGSLKEDSASRVDREFPDLMRPFGPSRHLWLESYFVGSTATAPISGMRRYLKEQGRSMPSVFAVTQLLPHSHQGQSSSRRQNPRVIVGRRHVVRGNR
ncbi:IS200/IS605 family transposase [Nocardia sp. CY41]|uniref:IS200/IS605 family transposase n=1 Tax=Nocardia sp. CY41 TaxID=2608686 RepID=UPI001F44C1A8|nr:IS200/IS605 family transposase [Nocardia sp. CY41]